MAPHCKRGDSGTASKPKRSDDVFIGEKVKILEIMEVGGKKGGDAEIAKLYCKNKSSICEVMKNKENISLFYHLFRIRLKR